MPNITELQENKSWIKEYLNKMRGGSKQLTHRTHIADALIGALGGFISIITLLFLTNTTGTQWMMTTLGGSCMLVFGIWNAPLSQPRNVICGHLLSTTIGIITYDLFGSTSFAISLAVCVTIFVMMLTRTIHPPAVGNPIIVVLGGYSWFYLVSPVLLGVLIIVFYGVLINNLRKNRNYPLFW